jgi:hypothetical protein
MPVQDWLQAALTTRYATTLVKDLMMKHVLTTTRVLILSLACFAVAPIETASAVSTSVSDGQKCSKSQIGKTANSNGRSVVCTKTARGQIWKSIKRKSQGSIPTTPTTYSGSTTWGEVSLVAVTPPKQGQCTEIPIRIDIRGRVGLGLGLIVSVEDAYQNQIGEMTRLTSEQQLAIGVSDYTIKVCGDPWILTYGSGATLSLSAVRYCGLNVRFFPYQKPISYLFAGC